MHVDNSEQRQTN